MAIEPGLDWAMAVRIQHFFLLNPVQFFHKALPHERDNDKPAAECTRAEFKGRKEQLPIFIFLVQ